MSRDDYLRYLELLKKDNLNIEATKIYILKILELFNKFAEDTADELTEEEALAEFLDAYREELKFTPGEILKQAYILNQYCAYRNILNMYKVKKQSFIRCLDEAKKAEKKSKKEELRLTLDSKKQIMISLREILRKNPNISEKDLLSLIQRRKSAISDYLKNELIKSIQTDVAFLNEYGKIDEYIEYANEILKESDLEEISYQKRNPIPDEYGDGKGNWIRYDEAKKEYVKYNDNGKRVKDGEDLSKYEQDIGVIDAFDEDFLGKLSLEDLYLMDTFWRSRYFDEVLQLAKAMYTMENLGLWNKVLNGKKDEIANISEEDILQCLNSDPGNEEELILEEIMLIRNTAKDLTIQECALVSKLKTKDFSFKSWGVIDYSDKDEHVKVAMNNTNFRGTLVIAVPKNILKEYIDGEISKLPIFKNTEIANEEYANIMKVLYIPATDFYKKRVMEKYNEKPTSNLYASLAGKKAKKDSRLDEEER